MQGERSKATMKINYLNGMTGSSRYSWDYGDKQCQKCGCHFPFLEKDHIVPQHKGGTDEPSNIQHICPNCHRIKTNKEHQKNFIERRLGEGNGFYGKKHTNESKRKMSESHKRKISESTTGKIKGASNLTKLAAKLWELEEQLGLGHDVIEE